MEKYMRTKTGEIVVVNERIRRALEDGLDEILGEVEYADRIEDLVKVGDIVNGRRVENGFDLYSIESGNIKVEEFVSGEVYSEVVFIK